MKAERWENIERIFNAAVALSPAERKRFLPRACGDDPGLLEEIDSMLTEDSTRDDFLSEPVFALGAKLLERDELLSQSEFAAYKLKKLLGRGGMGAVYLAEDTRLKRLVAVKILSPALAEDKQSAARFRQEARHASALSHPNIAHIYEFGEASGHLFLAMEYVEGRTVRELIREKALNTPLALSIAKQIALALISTHERGVVHRDIKPENIIVRGDGLIKVLDFGLAKLDEPKMETLATATGDALPSQIYTQAGMILGTVGYMSPEQIRGKELGATTDLWSTGVVLFEMMTGERPFQGETPSDVQAAILKDEPLAIGEPAGASGISRILKKALTKNVAERYRSAAEFAEDIERAQIQSDANFHESHRYFAVAKSAEYPVKDVPLAIETDGIISRRRFVLPAILISAVVAGWMIFQFAGERQTISDKFARLRTVRLTNSGNALRTAVSPDGQSLAYVLEESGSRGVYLRRKNASGAFSADSVALVTPLAGRQIRGVSFAPDGRQIYFRAKNADDAAFHLYRVAADGGGEPQKIIDDAQSTPSFSPDGKQMVFLRANADNSRGDLVIAGADGGNERVFYTRRAPEFFSPQAQPAWSPDGETILCSVATREGNREQMLPLAIRVSDNRAQPVFREPWSQIWTTQWIADGGAFVMTGRRDRSTDNNQLWRVAFPSGEVKRLTNDFNDYYGVSVSNRDGGAGVELTSVILNRKSQLWKADLASAPENARQMTEAGGDDGYGVSWARNGRIFYGSAAAGNPDVWTMNAGGGERRQLTFDTHLDSQPTVSPDGRRVVFGSLRSGIESLWRMNADGGEQTLLISDALREPLAITPDGWIYYHSTNGGAAMWRVPIDGGQPEKIVAGKYFPSAASPDGNRIAAAIRPDGAKAYSLAVLTVEGNSPRIVTEFKPADGAEFPSWLRWTPDGESIVYVVTEKGVGNLWAQPVVGGEPRQITNFASSRLYAFDFSPDGKQIICARGELSGYVVLLTDE